MNFAELRIDDRKPGSSEAFIYTNFAELRIDVLASLCYATFLRLRRYGVIGNFVAEELGS
jgi:hypothetical protein